MNRCCIIYYHGNDWSGVPARQRYLMEALSDRASIIYLDGGRDRAGRVDISEPMPNVTVVRGLASLLGSLARRRMHMPARMLARRVLSSRLKGCGRVIFWNAENSLRPYRFIRHHSLIFDCIDPAFSQDHDAIEAHEAANRAVIEEADLVFASAALLKERCEQHHSQVYLLNNACEPAEYSTDLVEAATRPDWWPDGSRPIAAYLGTLDWRVDFTALREAINSNPRIHFVVAGHILPEFAAQVALLSRGGNAVCPGRISVDTGRYLLANCHIGLIPFLPGEMNDAVNPVKLYAYSLLGKPVAATDLREIRERPEIALAPLREESFASSVARCMAMSGDSDLQDRLRAFAVANTWKHRSDQAWKIVQSAESGRSTSVDKVSAR